MIVRLKDERELPNLMQSINFRKGDLCLGIKPKWENGRPYFLVEIGKEVKL